MTVALLDGDIIAYRAAAVLTENTWDATAPKLPLTEDEAIRTALLTAENWREAVSASSAFILLTGRLNFRKTVLPSYKANRSGKPPPETLSAVKAALLALPNARLVEGLEADDLIGIMMTNGRHKDPVAVSVDKDMRTIPGNHYNPVKEEHHVSSQGTADYLWLMQTIMGDRVDGYTGIPGVGPKGAEKVLGLIQHGPVGTLWSRVEAAFQAEGLTPADALQQARVARILRSDDYDKTTQEVLLWHPTAPTRLPLRGLTAPTPAPSASAPPPA